MRQSALALAFLSAATLTAIVVGCGERQEPDPNASPSPATTTQGAETGFEIVGTWEGRLQQRGLEPFRVRATIASLDDSPRNRVSYSGIDCGGRWKYLGRNANSYKFREIIDEGQGRICKGIGTVRLAPTPGERLEYLFRGGGVTSRGVLTRSSG